MTKHYAYPFRYTVPNPQYNKSAAKAAATRAKEVAIEADGGDPSKTSSSREGKTSSPRSKGTPTVRAYV